MEKIDEKVLTANFGDRRDVIVLTLGASLKNGEHITDGQVGVALNMAKSGLQMAGADVDASSSAFLVSDANFQEGDLLSTVTTVELFKVVPEGEAAPNGELGEPGEESSPSEEETGGDDSESVYLDGIDEAE